jgi:hypothetical protein
MDSGGGRITGPDQHRPSLVPAKLVHRDDFLLQDLQQVIVQVELDLERTIRDTSATPQHLQCLLQDLVKGHGLPSPAMMATQVSLAAHHTRTQDVAPCRGRNRRIVSFQLC